MSMMMRRRGINAHRLTVIPLAGSPAIASVGTFANCSSVHTGEWDVPVPAGVASGTLVIAAIHAHWSTPTAPTTAAINPPDASWHAGPMYTYFEGNDHYSVGLFFFYKYATGSDTGTYIFSKNAVDGANDTDGFQNIVAFTIANGPTSGNPFVDMAYGNGDTSKQTIDVASFTPGNNNSLLLGLFGAEWNTLDSGARGPSGWALGAQSVGGGSIESKVWSYGQAIAAATGTLTWDAGQSVDGIEVLVATIRSA